MLSEEEIKLDVIPVYVNQIYPNKDMLWHFHSTIYNKEQRVEVLDDMIKTIKQQFCDCNAVIILEKGKVVEVL